MNVEDLEAGLKRAWSSSTPKSGVLSFVVIFGVGLGFGWSLHNHLWRKKDFDYTLTRAISVTAHCKLVSEDDVWLSIERRLGRDRSILRTEDKLAALDYLFDRIQYKNCVSPGPR